MLNRQYCFNTCQIGFEWCLSNNLPCILSELGNQRVYANRCALSLLPPPPPSKLYEKYWNKCISWCKFFYAQTLCFLSNYLNLAQFVLLTSITLHIYHFVNLRLFEVETSHFVLLTTYLYQWGVMNSPILRSPPLHPLVRIHVTSVGKLLIVITITSDRFLVSSHIFKSSLKTISILF